MSHVTMGNPDFSAHRNDFVELHYFETINFITFFTIVKVVNFD